MPTPTSPSSPTTQSPGTRARPTAASPPSACGAPKSHASPTPSTTSNRPAPATTQPSTSPATSPAAPSPSRSVSSSRLTSASEPLPSAPDQTSGRIAASAVFLPVPLLTASLGPLLIGFPGGNRQATNLHPCRRRRRQCKTTAGEPQRRKADARTGRSAPPGHGELAIDMQRILGVLREPLTAAPYECLLSVAADAPGSRMPSGQGLAGMVLPMLELQAI